MPQQAETDGNVTIGQIILFLGLAAYIIVTQLGRHPVSLHRLLMPIVLTIGVGVYYRKGVPTADGDLAFEILCALAGGGRRSTRRQLRTRRAQC